MKPTTFAILAVAAAAAIGGALYVSQERETVIAESFERRPLYPDLLSQVNDVDWLQINTQADGPLTMVKEGDNWILQEKHGYFADIEKISQTLVELSSMELLEPKTQKPENFAELQLQEVAPPDEAITNSIHVTVRADGQVLADLLVGRDRPADIGGGVFVRKSGENQAWLASGSYQPKRKALQWLDRNIINIDSRRIRHVTVQHADGDGFEVTRTSLSSEDMEYASTVPLGMEPKPGHEMKSMAQITDFLVLDDVRPAGEIDWSSPDSMMWAETFDGLKVSIVAKEVDGETWFKLLLEPTAASPALDGFVAKHQGEDSLEGRIADEMKTPAEVAAEIAATNLRLAPWAFQFTDYKSGKATERAADMLKQAQPGKG